jgi:hypothetical protein
LERGREGDAGVFDELGCCTAAVAADAAIARAREIRSGREIDVSIGDLFHGVRVVFSFPAKIKRIGG